MLIKFKKPCYEKNIAISVYALTPKTEHPLFLFTQTIDNLDLLEFQQLPRFGAATHLN